MICKWSQDIAEDTWNRIELAHKTRGFKIFETTVTQNLIYSVHKTGLKGIKILESLDEETNGNDFELYIKNKKSRKYRRFSIQAKIAYRTQKYEQINHIVRSSNTYQLDNLINFANSNQSIALYFLYSFSSKFLGNTVDVRGNKYSDFGISVIAAEYLKSTFSIPNQVSIIRKPRVIEIIELHGLTLHEFLCISADPKYIKLYDEIYPENSVNFVDEELVYDSKWQVSFKPGQFKFIPEQIREVKYNPRYRLVFDMK